MTDPNERHATLGPATSSHRSARRTYTHDTALDTPMTATPRIYASDHAAAPVRRVTRAVAACVAIACMAVLVVAARLSPDPSGTNTHTQLGLAPCGLLDRYGVPCPTCGMTTSFTHLAHGQVAASLVTQPAGTLLCALTAVAFWVGLYVALTGRPGAPITRRLPITGALLTLLAVVLLGWAYKVAIVVGAARG